MLVNLSKREIDSLCEFISYNNDIDNELDKIYDKLTGIVRSCECSAQGSDSDYAKSVDYLVNSMNKSHEN